MSKRCLLGEDGKLEYHDKPRWVLKSSLKDEGHNVQMRRGNPNDYKTDPWVSLIDYNKAIGEEGKGNMVLFV